jgi:hypothetical protein
VRGRPTHRVAKMLTVTCKKCLKALEHSKRAPAQAQGGREP